MAVKSQEAELIRGGCVLRSPSDGQYVQNMLFENGAFSVRDGFGQVTQLDTTLCGFSSSAGGTATSSWGYRKHLGSRLVKTSFGHEQIVSAFVADVHTSNLPHNANEFKARRNNFLPIYVISIYDLTTDSRWEEPVYRHTSESAASTAEAREMQFWHGHYETNADEDYQRWVVPVSEDPFYFAELYDVLYLGNADTGVMAYFPGTFRHARKMGSTSGDTHIANLQRLQQIDGLAEKGWAAPYSETALLKRVVSTSILENVRYVKQGQFPKPALVASFAEADGGSLVYVDSDRRTIFFSQAGYPASIPVDNYFTFPGDEVITAIAEQSGSLVIWTENTTWYYKPSSGFLHVDPQAGARLIKVSDSVGCVGPHAVSTGAGFGSLYWMDKNGCYQASGNMSIQAISQAIAPFFTDFITSPLHSYFAASGHVTTSGGVLRDQVRSALKFDPEGVNVTYWPKKRLTLFSIPAMSLILVWHEEGKLWTFWNTESMATQASTASDADSVAAVTRNIENSWLVNNADHLYLVGGIDTADGIITNITENANDGSAETGDNVTSRSYYILRYGRGGGVDRSVEEGEDQRQVVGRYRDCTPSGDILTSQDSYVILGRPIPVPYGQVVETATSSAASPIYWLPVSVVLGTKDHDGSFLGALGASKLSRLHIEFQFDSGAWAPVFRSSGASADTDYELAWEPYPERAASRSGWGYGNPVMQAGASYGTGRQVACFTSASPPVKSTSGNRIVATFHPTFTGSSYPAIAQSPDYQHGPYLNMQRHRVSRLMMLPFRATQTAAAAVGMGIVGVETSVYTTKAGTAQAIGLQFYAWDETFLLGQRRSSNVSTCAQAVDWAYKSDNIGLKEDIRVQARGTYTRMMSHGAAERANRVVPQWDLGLYNTLIGADLRGWLSQIVDVSPTTATSTALGQSESVSFQNEERTIRLRHKLSSSDASTIFSGGAVYGTKDSPTVTAGTYLIDDEDVSEMSVSASVKGDTISIMSFGYIRNKAEKIIVESVKALFRTLPAGRRRRGR